MQNRDFLNTSTLQITKHLETPPPSLIPPTESKSVTKHSNEWFRTFEAKEIIPSLKTYANNTKIDDAKLRTLFLNQTKHIVDYYKSEKQSTGQIENYIIAMEKLNKILDKTKRSYFGYAKFLPIFGGFLYSKYKKKSYKFSDDLQEIMEFAKKDILKKDGKRRLFNISCLAEQAFALLVVSYANFLLLSGDFKGSFDNTVVNLGFKIPILIPIAANNLNKLISKIELFEKNLHLKQSENNFYSMLRKTEAELEEKAVLDTAHSRGMTVQNN